MSDECYTPKWFIDSVRAVLGRIDLDPCSCEAANRIVDAPRFWNKDDDALSQPTWAATHGTTVGGDVVYSPAKVFMNPPYGRAAGGAGPYCHRLIDEWEAGNVSEAIILLNVATATKWMQPLFRFPMCFITPRIKFKTVDPETGELDFVRTKKGNICPRYDNVSVYLPRFNPDGYDHWFNENDVVQFASTFGKHGNVQVPFSMYDGTDYVDPETA